MGKKKKTPRTKAAEKVDDHCCSLLVFTVIFYITAAFVEHLSSVWKCLSTMILFKSLESIRFFMFMNVLTKSTFSF